ncbi:MAG: hypothetical protein WC749_13940, partial [Dehalococcoidia bacterium]
MTDLTVTNAISGSVTGSAATVTGAAQSAITSLGILTSLRSIGNIDTLGNVGVGTTATVSLLDVNQKFNVLSGGNVGIGITSPAGLLHIGSSLSLPYLHVSSTTGNVGIGTTAASNYNLYVLGKAYIGDVTIANGQIDFGGDLNMKGFDITNASNIGIGVSSPGTAALAVLGGNVGIGTTDPLAALAVGAASQFQVAVSTGNLSTSGNISTSGSGTITSAGAITAPVSTNTINSLIINSGALSAITTLSMSNQLTNSYANSAALNLTGNASGITFSGTGVNQIITGSNNHLALMPAGTGNVGIGTTNPVTNSKLDVFGRIVGGLNHAGESALVTSASEYWISAKSLITLGESSAGNANPAITMYRTAAGYSSGVATRLFQPSSAGDLYFQKGTNAAYGSETYTTNMVILGGGNVGIGTTSPQSKLAVLGGISVGTATYTEKAAPTSGAIIEGNVGIGTTAPGGYKLNVNGSGLFNNINIGTAPATGTRLNVYGQISMTGDTSLVWNNAHIYLNDVATGENYAFGNRGSYFSFSSETAPHNAVRMVIMAATGNVGIGTMSPQSKLAVLGGISVGTATYTGIAAPTSGAIIEGNVGIGTTLPAAKLDLKAAGTATGIALKVQNADGLDKLIVLDKGWVGIGTTPAYALHVDGDIRASGAIYGSTGIQVPVGTGTVNKMVKWSGTGTTLADAVAFDDGTNIGIGLTNPAAKLDILGSLKVSTTSQLTGNVGIGTTAASAYNLYVLGNLNTTAAITQAGTAVSLSGHAHAGSDITSGLLGLTYGGSNKNITASNGGIVWTDADSMEVLSGTATAGQILRSGANATPGWSTATYPATAASTGTILRADGTNWAATTATYPATTTVNQILYSSAANVISGATNFIYDGTNVGIGTATTYGRLQVGTTPAVPLLIVKDSGNVGIGTTTPVQPLHLYRSGFGNAKLRFEGDYDTGGTKYADWYVDQWGSMNISGTSGELRMSIAIKMANATNINFGNQDYYLRASAAGGDLQLFANDSDGAGTDWYAIKIPYRTTNLLLAPTTGNVGIGSTSPLGLLQVGTSPTAPGLQVLPNGNVGIGTTAASNYKLYVAGDTYIGGITVTSGTLSFGGALNMNSQRVYNIGSANSSFDTAGNLGIGVASPGTAALAVLGGNLGVGTTAPLALLQVGTSPTAGLSVTASG